MENLQTAKSRREGSIEISISDRIWTFNKNTRSINQNNVWQ